MDVQRNYNSNPAAHFNQTCDTAIYRSVKTWRSMIQKIRKQVFANLKIILRMWWPETIGN